MKGRLIVIEGLDGSGKATQAARLYDALCAAGYSCRKITFPNYGSPFCQPVEQYLAGALGSHPDDVNAYAASVLYTIDRFASFQQDWKRFYEEGGILVADRYTTSNAVHQCSKLPPEQWKQFTDWLFELEYEKVGIPRPDQVIYLDVDPKVSQKLLAGRYHGDEAKKDIHEKDAAYLARSREAAHWCADALGWDTIACCEQDAMRTVEDIAANVWDAVRRNL